MFSVARVHWFVCVPCGGGVPMVLSEPNLVLTATQEELHHLVPSFRCSSSLAGPMERFTLLCLNALVET